LLFNPFNKLPLGSLDSEVKGFPFFKGSLTKKMEKAILDTVQVNNRNKLAVQHRSRVLNEKGDETGTMFVRGRL